MTDELEARAQTIAYMAHRGQTDKAGEPYITHPERVVESLRPYYRTQPDVLAMAWLHDVLEDTNLASKDLVDMGIPHVVVGGVVALTRTKGVPSAAYYEGIRQAGRNVVAVKLADIADNSDPERLAKLDDETIVRLVKKYGAAREALR